MKDVSKSIRMSKRVYEIINEFSGKNFNEKFERFVIFYHSNFKDEMPSVKKSPT